MTYFRHVLALSLLYFAIPLSSTRLQAAEDVDLIWVWSGGLSDTEACVTAQSRIPDAVLVFKGESDLAETKLSPIPQPAPPTPKPAQPTSSDTQAIPEASEAPETPAPAVKSNILRYQLTNLVPETLYHYRFESPNGSALSPDGYSLKTFPQAGKPTSFRFALGACCKKPASESFAAALNQKPLFFLQTGDFHYSNIGDNNPARFQGAFQHHLQSPSLNKMLRSIPLFYMWDDHDFGPNDSNKSNPSKEAAHYTYRTLVPHCPLASKDTIDQAFTVGRVRFIMSDLRSERDPASKTMLSPAQMEWFKAELLGCKGRYPLIFWVSSVPWNGRPTGNDRWQGYIKQRQEIADFAKENGISGICVLAGDAHMAAIDDGRNSDFAKGGGAPFRVFQAGPLANKGSYKGGPYSHGARFGSEFARQFGLVDVEDKDGVVTVTLSARDGSDGIGDTVLTSEKDAEGPIELRFTIP